MAEVGTAHDPTGVTSTGKSGDPISLCGFLGRSDTDGYVRLFTDPALECWVDIREGDVPNRQRLPAEHDAFGGRSVVSVDSEALWVTAEVTTADAEAKFLTGVLSSEAPWRLGDDELDCATHGPKNIAYGGASPRPSPDPGCCR